MPICLLAPLLAAAALAQAPVGDLTTGVSSSHNPIASFSTPGTKTVTLKVCNSGGCTATTKTVTVLDPLPHITAIVGPDTIGTAQAPATYSFTLTGKPPLATSWTVAFPNGSLQTSFAPALSLTPLQVGIHTLTLKANNTSGVTSATRTVPVRPSYFSDVAPDYWASSFINTLYLFGFTSPCGTDPISHFPLFCPATLISRAELAVYLGRARHPLPYVPSSATGIFADVPPTAPYAPWVEQLYSDGITSGCQISPVRLFCPSANLTRAEMAVLLTVAAHGPLFLPPPATGIFLDVPPSYWAARWIELLYHDGISGGCQGPPAPRLFCPANFITRAEITVFVATAFHVTQHPIPTSFLAKLCSSSSCSYPAGLPVDFDVRLTSGIPESYDFDWNGDGTWDETASFPVSHTYTSPGTYAPRMRVRLGTTYSATLTHPTSIVINAASGSLLPPTNLAASATATLPPSPTDPPGTPIRISYSVTATSPSPTIRGYAAYVNSTGTYSFVTLLPPNGGALLLPPTQPGAPTRYLSLNAFTTTSRGPGSLGVPLP